MSFSTAVTICLPSFSQSRSAASRVTSLRKHLRHGYKHSLAPIVLCSIRTAFQRDRFHCHLRAISCASAENSAQKAWRAELRATRCPLGGIAGASTAHGLCFDRRNPRSAGLSVRPTSMTVARQRDVDAYGCWLFVARSDATSIELDRWLADEQDLLSRKVTTIPVPPIAKRRIRCTNLK